jgi:RNA polymerase sigma-70 factor (ECF subfamily)
MGHLELLGQLNHRQRKAWLFRVMKNRFIDEQRAQQRRQDLIENLSQDAWLATSLSGDEKSLHLFESVPEQYRELIHQRYVLGMNSTEIGRSLGIPAATVRSRLHLAIKWLRAHQSQIL